MYNCRKEYFSPGIGDGLGIQRTFLSNVRTKSYWTRPHYCCDSQNLQCQQEEIYKHVDLSHANEKSFLVPCSWVVCITVNHQFNSECFLIVEVLWVSIDTSGGLQYNVSIYCKHIHVLTGKIKVRVLKVSSNIHHLHDEENSIFGQSIG